MTTAATSAILNIRPMGYGPMPTLDPFLFCVYHVDNYPSAANDEMEAPRYGNGADFDPSADYRMYHGSTIPGFPSHPHFGFETITAVPQGMVDHADSLGNAGRYGNGDCQWMTAGKGCVHSEMFPLLNREKENPLVLFQIWLNLPKANKRTDPGFRMAWSENVPRYKNESGASVTVWLGNYFGFDTNHVPTPSSWAADLKNDVGVMHLVLQPGGALQFPAANEGKCVNRNLYYLEGKSGHMKINGEDVNERTILDVDASQQLEIEYSSTATSPGEFLILQGRPINEPVVQHGPFVTNTREEVQHVFMEYQRTQFGGWPWPRDDMVFPKEKGRFALNNGTENTPPDDGYCDTK